MDTRRTTLIATIIVIALLAVGIGYAYTAYTENSGNTSNVAYLKLTQTGNTGYTFADGTTPVQFDTFNEINTNTIYYALKNPTTVTDGTTGGLTNPYTCAKLGSITLQSNFTKSSTSITDPTTINIDVADSEKFDSDGTWVFFITNTSHDKIYAFKNTKTGTGGTDAWTDGPDALTVGPNGSVTIDILCGFDSTTSPAKEFDSKTFYEFGRDMSIPLLDGASLIFSAKDVGEGGEIPEPTHSNPATVANTLSAKTVTLNAGTGTGSPITVKYIGLYKLPKCTFTAPSEEEFSKWQIGSDQYDVGDTVTITEETTITAIWA